MTTFSLDNVTQTQDTTTLRAYATWLRDSIRDSGWVQTADTGQLDPTTLTNPAANLIAGTYLMYRMDDALKDTFPVLMKVEFGTGGLATYTWTRITIGSTTNNAGTFTGNSVGFVVMQGNGVGGVNKIHRASGANNRFACMLWGQPFGASSVAQTAFFNIERTHNPDGSDNTDGVMLVTKINTTSGQTPAYHNVLVPNSLTQSPTGMTSQVLGGADTAVVATSVRGTTAGVFPLTPFAIRPVLPMMNMLSYYDGDLSTLTPVSFTHYGATRTYLPLGKWNISPMSRNQLITNDASAAIMRWE